MKIIFKLYFIFFIFCFLQSCSSLKKGLGMEKEIPDEFLIKKNEDLRRPPNYELLPPESVTNKSEIKKNNESAKELVLKSFNNDALKDESIVSKSGNNKSSIENNILDKINK